MRHGRSPALRRENDGRIHFTVTSEGDSASDLIRYRSYPVEGLVWEANAKSLLHSPSFGPTAAGTRKKLVIVPGPSDFEGQFVPAEFCQQYWDEGLREPHVEDLALTRIFFSDEELAEFGFQVILLMHPPIRVCGRPCLLGMHKYRDGRWRAKAVLGYAGRFIKEDLRTLGFVFQAP